MTPRQERIHELRLERQKLIMDNEVQKGRLKRAGGTLPDPKEKIKANRKRLNEILVELEQLTGIEI